MKNHCKHLTVSLISILAPILLNGCSNMMSSRMPSGSASMREAYNDAINGTGSSNLSDVTPSKAYSITQKTRIYTAYTRTQKNEIDSQFPQLPNPSIVMYVYPHEAGSGFNKTPIPGYSTVFPIYQHVYYAMPGEIASVIPIFSR